jgi:hypothetical protein
MGPKVTQIVVETRGAHEVVRVWVNRKLSGELTVGLGEGDGVAKLLKGTAKLDVSKEPHWLYKDFNVLYRVAKRFHDVCSGLDGGKPYEPMLALRAQLERLVPAFTDTEEIRAAQRGE